MTGSGCDAEAQLVIAGYLLVIAGNLLVIPYS
jgi:hypothetical protein